MTALRAYINNQMDQFDRFKLKDALGGTVYVTIGYYPRDGDDADYVDIDNADQDGA